MYKWKKVLALFFAAVFIFSIFPNHNALAADTVQTGRIVNCSTGVNVRTGPGTSYSKLGFAPKNAVYNILGKSGSWYKIDYQGLIGYVSSAYVSLIATVPATSTPSGQTGKIVNCASGVNVRSGPGSGYPKLGVAPKGSTYPVLGKSGSYYIILFNGTNGYIYSSYISVTGSTPTPTASTPAPTSSPSPTPSASASMPTPTPTSVPLSVPTYTSNKIVAGYYASWAAYSGYTPNKIPAGVTHVIYAFANIGPDLKIQMGDVTIDPSNFDKLRQLKLQRPNLKTLISVGGWTWSDKFSDATVTDARRTAFADSVVAFIAKYGFDGVDIDWEYPVSGGLPYNITRPEDKTNFTLLMEKLRKKLDEQGSLDGRRYLLSFAGASGTFYANNTELAKLADYADFATVMTYDMHGPWDSLTDFNAPLYTPSENTPQYKWSCNAAVKLWVNEGFPKTKLLMGIPFYGVAYSGVTNAGRGLYQTFGSGSSISYDMIKLSYLSNPAYTRYDHLDAQVPWLFNGSTVISFDDPQSISAKAGYIKDTGLAGAAIWELSQNVDGTLFNVLNSSMQ